MNGGRENLSPSACWGQVAYAKYLEFHPDYTIKSGGHSVFFDSTVSRGSNRHTHVCFPPTRIRSYY